MCNKQAEIVLREYQLAGLIHELKSPLAAIQSALDILKEPAVAQNTPGQGWDYLGMIDRNTIRLRTRIDSILEVISWKDRKEELLIRETDLGQLCAQAAADYLPIAQTKDVAINVDIVPEPLYARCDAGRIGVVLSNLFSNAVKFTAKGQISIRIERREKSVEVSVEDSGIGISPRDLPRVFDRFFQGERCLRTRGLGLGLTIAKFWVEAHGGRIGAESKGPGLGSRFWFSLPQRPLTSERISFKLPANKIHGGTGNGEHKNTQKKTTSKQKEKPVPARGASSPRTLRDGARRASARR